MRAPLEEKDWFREAIDNALAAGHLSQAGHANLIHVLQREEDDESDFVCVMCGKDCRDIFGGASRACVRAYNAD